MTRLRRLHFLIALLIAVLAGGTLGYVLIEGYPFVDALYMTVITLSTVGYGETHPLHPAGRWFTILLIAVGFGTVYAVLANSLDMLFGEQLREIRGRRRMEHRLHEIREHTLICGYGRMGQEIGREFQARGLPFVVIECDPEQTAALDEAGILHVVGDAADDACLHAAGIDRARGLVAVAHTDADNIFIVLSARALNPKLYIVARSILEENEHKLGRAGADRVVSPYVIGARRIAAAVFRPEVIEYLDLHTTRAGEELDAVTVTASGPFCDRTLEQARIREQTGCIILAIRPRETAGVAHRFHSSPPPDTPLRDGDILIALGTPAQLTALEKLARAGG